MTYSRRDHFTKPAIATTGSIYGVGVSSLAAAVKHSKTSCKTLSFPPCNRWSVFFYFFHKIENVLINKTDISCQFSCVIAWKKACVVAYRVSAMWLVAVFFNWFYWFSSILTTMTCSVCFWIIQDPPMVFKLAFYYDCWSNLFLQSLMVCLSFVSMMLSVMYFEWNKWTQKRSVLHLRAYR